MAKLETLTDDFTALDTTTKWAVLDGSPTVSGGVLTSASGDSAIMSQAVYDLSGSHVVIQFPTVTVAANAVLATPDFSVVIVYQFNGSSTGVVVNGSTTGVATSSDSWWRVRESSGTIHLDSAADGQAWTNHPLGATSNPFTTDIALVLSMGVGDAIDNLNLPPGPPVAPSQGDFFAFF